jgi:hypothetical protein
MNSLCKDFAERTKKVEKKTLWKGRYDATRWEGLSS